MSGIWRQVLWGVMVPALLLLGSGPAWGAKDRNDPISQKIERERRTLEALLVTPPSRWILAAGKFLAVTAASMAAARAAVPGWRTPRQPPSSTSRCPR